MFVIAIIIEFYILFDNIEQSQTLVQLPIIENYHIAITETVIRNTVNDLFAALKIPETKNRTRIKQFSTIHNFFVSITLTDCDNLKKISRLSTVGNIDNGTQHFIVQINEVLNEGDKNIVENEEENNIYVATYIEKFIKKLKHLKDTYASYTNTVIKSDILKYFVNDRNALTNVTKYNINSSAINEQSMDADKVLGDEYWHGDSRRLYKGIRTKIKKYPFIASIHFFKKFQCAGSIIKNDLVITSSSCLQIAWNNRFFRENPAFLSVRVGCDYYDFCGDSIAVLEIFFHPQYEPKTLKHNLAIMRLTRNLHFRFSHGNIKKIDFDRNPWPLPVNSKITVVGWGAKDAKNVVEDVFKNKLSYAELDYFLLEDCQDYYSKDFVSHYHFCAGFYSKGGGACSHDAGGPGIYNSLLMGVISFGSSICGATKVPTVFTKLGFYADWIEDIVEKEHPSYRVDTTTAPPKRIYRFTTQSTTEQMKIIPFGDTAIGPKYPSETNVLRIPQELAFQDFLSTIFESADFKTYIDTSDTETNDKLEKELASDLKLEPTKMAVEKVQEHAYNNVKINRITEHINEPTPISVEAIDSLQESNVNDEIERTYQKSTTETLNNFSNEHEITKANGTTIVNNRVVNNISEKLNPEKKPWGKAKSSTMKHNVKEIADNHTFTVTDSIEHSIVKVKSEETSIETDRDSLKKDKIVSVNLGVYDKILEENIKTFLDHLDLEHMLIQNNSLEISKTSKNQEFKFNKTLNEGEANAQQRSILDLLFFSDEKTDETDEKELSMKI